MPFVIVIAEKHVPVDPGVVREIEEACKDAWTSMGSEDKYRRGDVGGILLLDDSNHPIVLTLDSPLVVLFPYVGRGEEFHTLLYGLLHQHLYRFHSLLGAGQQIGIKPIPVQNWQWFMDPVWSQTPCDRPHAPTDFEKYAGS